jgi:hypothetical protein
MKSRKALYEQALGHGHGHIEEGASTEKLHFRVSEIRHGLARHLATGKPEMMKYEIKASFMKIIQWCR